jgi:hypothetical protein
MQNSSLAQSALEAHAAPPERQVEGNFGHTAEPGATHAPVVTQHTSPAVQVTPPQTTGVIGAQTGCVSPE